MEIAAPAVLVRQHVAVTGRDGCSRSRNGQLKQRSSKYVAILAPIEARVRNKNLNSADEQGQKAQSRNPVGDANKQRVARTNRGGWPSRISGRDPNRIGHLGNCSNSAWLVHAISRRGKGLLGGLSGSLKVLAAVQKYTA